MKYGKLLLNFLIFCAWFVGAGKVYSQATGTGTLMGRVISFQNSEPLPGAIVLVVGTNNGAATDLNGNYIIRGVSPGKQTIRVSYVGYKTKEVIVNIKSAAENRVEIKLRISAVQGRQVVVTAQRIGQQEAINQQINSVNIANVVAPDRLQANPDQNAAEAIGRLPGISLIRTGGEGTGIVIRGMMPQYSTVTINGVELPSNDLTNRSTSISGLSQFMLQKVEVYKTVTPDMNGNSVAGSVNLTLSPAPKGFKHSLLLEGGYNNLNEYWGNYKIVGDLSNRFLDNKLGVRFDFDAERNNRSTQTMGASYSVQSNTTGGAQLEQVYLGGVNLNDITDIPSRNSGMLSLDYSFSPVSKIFVYSLLSEESEPYIEVTKSVGGGGYPSVNVADNNTTDLLFSAQARVEHTLSWANIDYGAAFSETHDYDPQDRNWTFVPDSQPPNLTPLTNAVLARITPQQFAAMSNGTNQNTIVSTLVWRGVGFTTSDELQHDLTSYLDIKIPFTLGGTSSGFLKTGAKYQYTNRQANELDASNYPTSEPAIVQQAVSGLNWTSFLPGGDLTAEGLVGHEVSSFLGDQYEFGFYPNMGRLNQLWDTWNSFSNRALAEGPDSVAKKYGAVSSIGFVPDILGSSINDQNLNEEYIAGYLMGEINLGSLVTFVPGVRYEQVTDHLVGHQVVSTASPYGIKIPGTLAHATHNDEFWLPMVHLQLKPTTFLHIDLSYTNTVFRPNFNALTPNKFTSSSGIFIYDVGNPNLKPELWRNFDLQMALYDNELGLVSVDGFYKNVKNKIWQRSYLRLPGDPLIPGFANNVDVNVTEWLNHKDPGYVEGAEFEWETNFWYLPVPFSFFSLNANFTILRSQQQYPFTRLYTTYQYNSSGRPTATLHRVDSSITDAMLNQPNSIANVSLGFNYQGLNAWLSFQYNGKTLTGWTDQRELIPYRGSFYEWDFQLTQALPVNGMEVLFDLANISNYQQENLMLGDPRFTYQDSYGWTSDLGLRYNF